jgi:hypothetical protein
VAKLRRKRAVGIGTQMEFPYKVVDSMGLSPIASATTAVVDSTYSDLSPGKSEDLHTDCGGVIRGKGFAPVESWYQQHRQTWNGCKAGMCISVQVKRSSDPERGYIRRGGYIAAGESIICLVCWRVEVHFRCSGLLVASILRPPFRSFCLLRFQ